MIEHVGGILSLSIYFVFSYKLLKKYQAYINEFYPNIKKIDLKWLKIVFNNLGIILLFWAGETFVDIAFFKYDLPFSDYYFIYIYLSIVFYYLAIKTILKPEEKINNNREERISDDMIERLINAFTINKKHLDSKLLLYELSNFTNISERNISKIIKTKLGKNNFCDFVNEYRIKEAKIKLSNPENKDKIIKISEDSGFSSRSSFYELFKQQTGFTPSEYRKRFQEK